MQIQYAAEPGLSVDDFRAVLVASTLGARRPVDEPERLAAMLKHANLIVTARVEGRLVGVSRALTDFSFCCYVSDLAVDLAWQRRGIGKALLQETRIRAGTHAMLLLISAPAAERYYPHIGMTHVPSCWAFPRSDSSSDLAR
jgi:GNAT superfamily N-acetyltransferase